MNKIMHFAHNKLTLQKDVIHSMDYFIFALLILSGIIMFIHSLIREKKASKSTHTSNKYLSQLNKCESPIERKVFKALWYNGIEAVTQYPVSRYRLDLALPSFKIAIECDGKAYHSSPEQKAHDRKRDAFLRKQGWKVLRFSGSAINKDISKVVQRINRNMMIR